MICLTSRRYAAAFSCLLLATNAASSLDVASPKGEMDGAGEMDLRKETHSFIFTDNTEESDYSIVGLTNHTNRASAGWEPWPEHQIRNLQIVHNLCDDEELGGNWLYVLNKARKQWNRASPYIRFRKPISAGCNPKVNSDLTYIDNKIHVVYGTCGGNCCGRADVEYWFDGSGKVTKYSSLVRFDPDSNCVRPGNLAGMIQLACHEFGHVLGLDHEYGVRSCMGHYTDGFKPGPNDIKTLADLYGDSIAKPSKL